MNRTILFLFLIVLIGGIIYVLKTSDNPPMTDTTTQTPKEYIEYVEQKKASKRAAQPVEEASQAAVE